MSKKKRKVLPLWRLSINDGFITHKFRLYASGMYSIDIMKKVIKKAIIKHEKEL